MEHCAVPPQICMIFCNCPDEACAAGIGESLVASRLAAAVNLIPGVTSFYRWRGEVQTSREVTLVIKTSTARCSEVEEQVRAMHPYELPGILALSVTDGSPDYLQWIGKQTSAPQ